MQLHKNKILVFSAVYITSLIVIATIFGMWHNVRLTAGKGNYLLFLSLLLILTGIITSLYFVLFRFCRKEIEEKAAEDSPLAVETEQEANTDEEEKVKESFNKEAFIASVLPGNKKSVTDYCEEALQKLASKLSIVQGIFYIKAKDGEDFEPAALYAYYSDKTPPMFKMGETLPGQALKDKRVVVIQNIPEGYVPVVSGLGSGKPKTLVMIPIIGEIEPIGLIEIAVFTSIDSELEPALKELGAIIGKNITKLMK